ncbi:MAG: ABC transporter permease [Hormoscilla sp.]
MNPRRILVIAKNVFVETIRDRVLYLILLFGLLLVGSLQILPEVAAATEDKMFLDVGLGAMTVLGLIVAVFVGTGLISKEIERRTVYILVAKPISYSELILGKHLGLSATLAVLVAAMMVLYLGICGLSKTAYPSLAALAIAAVFLLIQLSLITAVAILFGVLTRPLLGTLLTFGVYLMGNLSGDMVRLNQLVNNPNFSRMTDGIYLIFPDLSRLDLKNLAVYGMAALPDGQNLLLNASYGLVYTIGLLAIAIAIFSRREF